jgi:4'-phosphopantetheinyl transferase EntD
MAELSDRLRECLPKAVGVGVVRANAVIPAFDGEVLPAATAQRLAEFRGGREAARCAMVELGVAKVAVPMAADRSPIWPPELVGSISHCDGFCLALVAYADRVRGLGLDVETLRDLPSEIWETVLRPEEIRYIQAVEPGRQGQVALAYFVAKEAVYKAQYPISKRLFDFQTIRIIFESQRFMAEFMSDIPAFPCGTRIIGDLIEAEGFLAAVVVLPELV